MSMNRSQIDDEAEETRASSFEGGMDK